jgi:hemoglobin/transferrin/lactoferrin receptor protein
VGVYIQDEWELTDRLTAIPSARYDYFRFESDVDQYYVNYVQDPANNYEPTYDPYNDEFTDTTGEFSGGLGFLYSLTEEINLITSYSHGYRYFGPKFGLTLHGEGYRAPTNEILDPIQSDTFEVGTKVLSEKFSGSLFTYYSGIRNWQTWTRGDYNGQTQINGEDVYVLKTGKANVYGVELETETRLDLIHDQIPPTWSFFAGFAWNYGDDRASDEPMRHTHPARSVLALRWKDEDRARNGWFELSTDIVRHYDRIPSDRLQDDVGYKREPQDGSSPLLRDYGLPGYTVFAVRGGLDIIKNLSLTVAVENLTDKKFRRAHSRWDEAGINFLTSLTYRF